jgi:hypothetical protein
MSLEDTLARTFDAANDRAPGPPPDFVAGVLARQRRRQQLRAVRVTGLATVSLAAVAGVSLVAAHRGGRPGVLPLDRLSFGPPLDLRQAKPGELVWPDAISGLPGRLPDGRDYVPLHWVSPEELVVLPSAGQVTDPPALLSTRTGLVTEVVGNPGPSGPRLTGLAVAERRLYWVLSDQRTIDVEAMSWPDEVIATVAQDEHSVGESAWFDVVAAGDTVYVVAHRDAGVTRPDALEQSTVTYRAAGGLKPVAGSAGWFPAGGAWLRASRLPSGRAGAPQFWNLATGERRTPAVPPGWTVLAYGPERSIAERDGVLVAYRFDGTDAIAVSAPTGGFGLLGLESPGRFVVIYQLAALNGPRYLWDLERHRIGRFDHSLSRCYDGLVLSERDATKVVLDLDRIA